MLPELLQINFKQSWARPTCAEYEVDARVSLLDPMMTRLLIEISSQDVVVNGADFELWVNAVKTMTRLTNLELEESANPSYPTFSLLCRLTLPNLVRCRLVQAVDGKHATRDILLFLARHPLLENVSLSMDWKPPVEDFSQILPAVRIYEGPSHLLPSFSIHRLDAVRVLARAKDDIERISAFTGVGHIFVLSILYNPRMWMGLKEILLAVAENVSNVTTLNLDPYEDDEILGPDTVIELLRQALGSLPCIEHLVVTGNAVSNWMDAEVTEKCIGAWTSASSTLRGWSNGESSAHSNGGYL